VQGGQTDANPLQHELHIDASVAVLKPAKPAPENMSKEASKVLELLFTGQSKDKDDRTNQVKATEDSGSSSPSGEVPPGIDADEEVDKDAGEIAQGDAKDISAAEPISAMCCCTLVLLFSASRASIRAIRLQSLS
jgi:hypothetical protein